jgi:PIN domain nuclease of toxin-antitoxin system
LSSAGDAWSIVKAGLFGRGAADHADSFDRLLVAQAAHEAISLVTPDQTLRAYEGMVMAF